METRVAKAVLRGARMVDVAEINGLKYSTCREYLHRYCRTVNREAYEKLSVMSAKSQSSPVVVLLQNECGEFLPAGELSDEGRTTGDIEQGVAAAEEVKKLSGLRFRMARAEGDQLKRDLKRRKKRQVKP